MNDRFTEQLDDLMDRFVYGLLDEVEAARVRRKIEADPEWQLAYEAAGERKRLLAEGVRAGAAEGAAAGAPSADEVLAAARKAERADRRRRRIIHGVFGGIPAAAAAVILVLWVYAGSIRPPGRVVHLLGQTTLMPGTTAGLLARVTDPNGKGLPGVPVALMLAADGAIVELARWVSGPDGLAGGEVAVPDGIDGECTLVARAGEGRAASVLEVPITIRRSVRLFLSTDKPIYQPGQTIHMRCLALRKPHLKPDAGRDATLSVTDPAGNVIFSRTDKLSDFGLTWADLPTDPLITPGRYVVKAAVGSDVSEQTVEIFHYKLPAFAVKIELDRPYYLAGQTVAGKLNVRYHFGKPAAAATVIVDLTGRELARAEPLGTTTVTTDAEGNAEFELKLPATLFGSARSAGDARLLLTARATDTAGQENTAYRTVVVARHDIRIAAVAESGADARLPSRVYVVTSYPDGRPAKAVVDVESLGRSFATDAAGVVVIAAKNLPDPLRLSARDAAGKTGRAELSLPQAAGDAFILRTDRPIYTAGRTANVEVVAAADGDVFVDVIKDRQTVLTRTLTVTDGRGKLAMDLPAEVSGVLHLHAYRLDNQGEWVGRDVLVVVRPADQLKVVVESDRPVYRPGEQAKLTFKVTDASGKGAPAALSLAAVDEAVYSVQQAAPGLEALLTGLDEELLVPAVEVHGFSPSLMDRSDDYARALLAAAAPRPPTQTSKLQMLVRQGLISPDMLRGWRPAQIREALRRSPSLARQLGPELLAEILGERPALHTLDVDNQIRQQSDYDRRKGAAKTAAGVASLIGGVVAVASLLIWALVAGLTTPNAGRGPRISNVPVQLFIVLALVALLVGIFMPTLGRSRELARRAMVAADLNAMGRAMALAETDAMIPGPSAPDDEGPSDSPRLRTYFPETMLWRPQVITDADGRAELTVPLADSITTWRLSGSAVSQAGRLGAVDASVRVFQEFFVDVDAPLTLTAGDEVAAGLVLYNYTDAALTVTLDARAADGLTVLAGGKTSVLVKPGRPRRVYIRVKADKPGMAALTVSASAGKVADAIRREIRIAPPGLPRFVAVNGTVEDGEQVVDITVPADAVADSVAVVMKLYPSTFSELLDGLENILRMPHGCFEQTSSTTWPNVMALSYMKAEGIASPEVTAKATRYIHLGCQRLVSFEVVGGGFDWFGRAPANIVLTAYGLMEFTDMAAVHNVDPKLLARTADWLAGKQAGSGAWRNQQGMFHEPFTGGDVSDLAVTAYVTWALAGHDRNHAAARRGADFVRARLAEASSAYTLALCANALLTIDARDPAGLDAAARLARLGQAGEKKQTYWTGGRPSGAGSGDVSATALAAMALLRARQDIPLAHGALRWLAGRRDAHGTWGSTTPTVLALRALLAGASAPQKRTRDAVVAVRRDGERAPLTEVTIRPDESDVVRTVRLKGMDKPGRYRLRLTGREADGMGYQFAVHYYSLAAPAGDKDPLALTVRYDRTAVGVGDTVAVKARVTNRTNAAANMLVVDLGTPPGFVVRPAGLERLRRSGAIQRYTLTARGVIVYLDRLAAGASVKIDYEIVARMPIRAVAAPAKVYTYYAPDQQAAARGPTFHVK